MHIYTLSFTDPRIVNSCELLCFYDFKITSDKFNQLDYIIFSIQFLKFTLFFWLVSYATLNGLLFCLHYFGLLDVALLMWHAELYILIDRVLLLFNR